MVQHLIDTKRINALLAQLMMNLEVEEEAMEVSANWHGWIAEQLCLGSPPEELVEILKHHGFSHDSSVAVVAGK